MKISLLAFLAASLLSTAFAGVETWTNKSGKTVQMELLSVSEMDGQKVGEFKTPAGATAKIKASDLAEADARKLAEWKPPVLTPFDDFFEKDLVKLEGKSLKRLEGFVKPTKYYLFYYTASWCPYCQKFAPDMLKFYQEHKDPRYEVILISSDHDEKAMEDFAAEEKMPWPQLKFSRIEKFKKEIKHPVDGIPALILTDAEGKVFNPAGEGKPYPGYTATLFYLDKLLKK